MNLKDLKDALAHEAEMLPKREAHALGICARCRKPPTFTTEAGRREYPISGVCEPCFDELFQDEEG